MNSYVPKPLGLGGGGGGGGGGVQGYSIDRVE